MKFLRVEVNNWRPFRGQSAMNIASSDTEPITLVFGKNGGGKTAMLSAIYWCLYGEMDLEQGKGDQNRVNDYAVQESDVTKDTPAQATVTLYASITNDDATTLYRIERRHNAYEIDSIRTETPGGFTVTRVKPYTSYRSGDDVVAACQHPHSTIETFEGRAAKRVIDSLLPKGLSKYFFYPGETLSFPFKNDRTSKSLLQDFLLEISGQSKFSPYSKIVANARKILDAKSKSYAEADKETRRLQHEIEDLQKKIREHKDSVPTITAELEAAETNYDAVVAQLDELGAFKDVITEAKLARLAEREAESTVQHAEQQLADAIGNAYLHVATPVFDSVVDVFSQRKYPNDISSTLVAQMGESMICICGRELTDELLQRLEPLSPTDDSVIRRMITLNSHATALRGSDATRSAVDTARVALNDSISARREAIEARDTAENRLTNLGADQFDEVKGDSLVDLRTRYDNQIRELSIKLGTLESRIKDLEQQLAKKDDAKSAAAPKIHKNVHRAAAMAREMDELLNNIKRRQADVARVQLEKLINENYVIYKDNIRAGIDADFRVRVYDRTGSDVIEKPVGDLSGSETALLTYAFAAAAAKLLPQYQTLDKLLTTIPVFEDVEPIPLVLDAPFASLGTEYKRRVMDLMTKGFSQVVMFTESTDLDVLEASINKIGAEYVIRFEGKLSDATVRTFQWRGRDYTYASHNSATARSTLERIENDS